MFVICLKALLFYIKIIFSKHIFWAKLLMYLKNNCLIIKYKALKDGKQLYTSHKTYFFHKKKMIVIYKNYVIRINLLIELCSNIDRLRSQRTFYINPISYSKLMCFSFCLPTINCNNVNAVKSFLVCFIRVTNCFYVNKG